jgi:site-specific DNA recombinase
MPVKNGALRALLVVRLSKLTEQSTSPERQQEVCEELCRQRGWVPVAVCSDIDVSGSKNVDPFDPKQRPGLAGWLAGDHPEPYEVIVTYRCDRLTRSVKQLQRLVHWAEDNNKLIVSATEPHFDMSSPFAAVLVALIGMVAEFELEAISARNASTARRNIRLGMYRGSTPPFGYAPEKINSEWRLVPDPFQAPVVNEIVRRVLDLEPLQKIAIDLTARGVLTPKDLLRQRQGKPIKGTEWSQTVLKRSLTSEAMLGWVMSEGKPLRNDDGSPIQRSEPLMTREVFDRVRAVLESRTPKGGRTPAAQSLLTGVLRCGVCGEPAYRFNGGSHSQFPRYRCRSMNKSASCGNRTVKVTEVDETLERVLLGLFGPFERRSRVWSEGSDRSGELADVNALVADLTSQIGTGLFTAGSPQRAVLDERIASAVALQRQLEAEAVVPSQWVWVGTGERFVDWWAGLDVEAKNNYLRSMNVTVVYDRDGIRPHFGEMVLMLSGVDDTGLSADVQEFLAVLAGLGVTGVEVAGDEVTLVQADGGRFTVTV